MDFDGNPSLAAIQGHDVPDAVIAGRSIRRVRPIIMIGTNRLCHPLGWVIKMTG